MLVRGRAWCADPVVPYRCLERNGQFKLEDFPHNAGSSAACLHIKDARERWVIGMTAEVSRQPTQKKIRDRQEALQPVECSAQSSDCTHFLLLISRFRDGTPAAAEAYITLATSHDIKFVWHLHWSGRFSGSFYHAMLCRSPSAKSLVLTPEICTPCIHCHCPHLSLSCSEHPTLIASLFTLFVLL